MVNQFLPLTADIHDWNTTPLVPPPTGSPVVVFDIPALGAGASQTLIPAQSGFQIALTQLYVYYPRSNAASSLLFESSDGVDVALDVPSGTDVQEIVSAGTLLLAGDTAFIVHNPGAGPAEHLQGWVTYQYVAAPVSPTQVQFTFTAIAAGAAHVLVAGVAGHQIEVDSLYVYANQAVANTDVFFASADTLNVLLEIKALSTFGGNVSGLPVTLGPAQDFRVTNFGSAASGLVEGYFKYTMRNYPP